MDTFFKLDTDVLSSLEQVWGFNLPKEYREFLLKTNGFYPDKKYFKFKNKEDGSIIQGFLGITSKIHLNLLKEIKVYEDRILNTMFPIAYDTFGNLILLSVKGSDRGKIYFWDHEQEADPAQGEVPNYSNLTLIADSFDEFIEGLTEDIK